MEEYNIKKTLKECKRAAYKGYKISINQYKCLNEILMNSSDKIESTLININNSDCFVSEATEKLTAQLVNTRDSLRNLSSSLYEDLNDLYDNLSQFSITLFGRTMAGKSTLMEILTEGDGTSIGKGAQRTTRDTRTYKWNDLLITDVPGTSAHDGEEDEMVAFSKARKADLILFLITDDAPQASEAERLSQIIELGKPVICVLNVKSSIRENDNHKMISRSINKAFDDERLNTIKKQFSEFAYIEGEDWEDIPIISVHLKAAFMAQKTEDLEWKKELSEVSHINDLKARIIEEVLTHGKYYREKNFFDMVASPSLDIYENLLFNSDINVRLEKTIREKRLKLDEWTIRFQRDTASRINSLISEIESELRMEIPSFAEEHFDDKNVDFEWKQLIIEKKVESRCNNLENAISTQAENKLKELSREMSNELKYMLSISQEENFNIPKMHRIFDAKKAWNWGMIIAGGGLTTATIILTLIGSTAAGPVGWITAGVGVVGLVGSFLFLSREKKEENAKRKLEKNLNDNVTSLCKSLKKQLDLTLSNIIEKRLFEQRNEIVRIENLINYLGNTQRELAFGMKPNLLDQSKQVLGAAFKLVFGAGKYANKILSSARVPGKMIYAQIKEETSIPDKKMNKLNRLVQEEIHFIEEITNEESLIKEIIGEGLNKIIYEDEGVRIEVTETNQEMVNRTRIAQQYIGKYFRCTRG